MKILFGFILTLALLMGGYLIMNLAGSPESAAPAEPGDNVTIVDGVQIVEIRAKGGYLPRTSVAKAGIPTILRVDTNGTFDCSSALRVPSLKVSENLPMTGTTDIPLGELAVGTLDGNCGMGMYPFQITVEN